MKLYHVTKPENVESILNDGLLRCHGDHKSAFVFLSKDQDSWLDDGLVLLEDDEREPFWFHFPKVAIDKMMRNDR